MREELLMMNKIIIFNAAVILSSSLALASEQQDEALLSICKGNAPAMGMIEEFAPDFELDESRFVYPPQTVDKSAQLIPFTSQILAARHPEPDSAIRIDGYSGEKPYAELAAKSVDLQELTVQQEQPWEWGGGLPVSQEEKDKHASMQPQLGRSRLPAEVPSPQTGTMLPDMDSANTNAVQTTSKALSAANSDTSVSSGAADN
jgi:hypothetical protein